MGACCCQARVQAEESTSIRYACLFISVTIKAGIMMPVLFVSVCLSRASLQTRCIELTSFLLTGNRQDRLPANWQAFPGRVPRRVNLRLRLRGAKDGYLVAIEQVSSPCKPPSGDGCRWVLRCS